MLHTMRRTNIILISGGIVFGLVLVVELLRLRSPHAATLRPPEELAVTSCPNTPIKIPTLPPPESLRKDKVSYRHNLTISPDPTLSFRDNLWSNKKYITSWGSAGFTNDFMAYMNLIYLAILTERIPILPPPSFSHHVQGHDRVWFKLVFDIDALSESLQWPILDWSEVKAPKSEHQDTIGCWSTWKYGSPELQPRWSSVPVALFIDPSYTVTPLWTLFEGGGPRLSAVSSLGFPTGRKWARENAEFFPSLDAKHKLPPDEHLFCLDYLYYAGIAFQKDMFGMDWSPGWRKIARHARYNKVVLDGANRHLRRLFSVPRDEAVPPFVAVHIRREDFGGWCHDVPVDECLAPPSAYRVRVREIQEELLATKNIHATHVVFSSDDNKPSQYWEEVATFGWKRLAFEKDDAEMALRESLGGWAPTIMDTAIQSLAIGFVGTEFSTFSLLSQHRVEDWNGGVTRSVMWGTRGADGH